jgi:non-specific serine/threonine protein kinase
VTLTGPGGIGKTRLGLAAAAAVRDAFADGVWLVELAPLTDPDLVAGTIATVLQVPESGAQPVGDRLHAYLHAKQALLVLDNFEHLLAAAPLVEGLLKGAPRLKVLATSRAPLGVYGEREFLVPPLTLPDRRRLPALDQLLQYEAVRLFVERTQARQPAFVLNAANAPAVVEICWRLDGLPLAIELAAARGKLFPPAALLARLAGSLGVLTGGVRTAPLRQQTLRAAIDWSYQLLTPEEQRLFRHMAVFQGGCRLEGVETVCQAAALQVGGPAQLDVPAGVESLIAKSLVERRAGADGEPRCWMLETIHEYAREKLQESGEAAALQRAHAGYCMRLAEEADAQLTTTRGAERAGWYDRLAEEHDNLREALRWARRCAPRGPGNGIPAEPGAAEEAAGIGLRIAAALGRFWWKREHYSEGRAQLAAMLALDNTHAAEPLRTIRAKALNGAGVLAWAQGDYLAARPLHAESLAVSREVGDPEGIATALTSLGNVAIDQGDYAAARVFLAESLAFARASGDRAKIAPALNNLGNVAYSQEDYAAARALYEESLTLFREVGSNGGVATALSNLGNLASLQGDDAQARAAHEESLALRREIGIQWHIADSLNSLGHLVHRQGDLAGARQLYRESLSISREIGAKLLMAAALTGWGAVACTAGRPAHGARLLGAVAALVEALGAVQDTVDRVAYTQGVASARAQLDDATFTQAWTAGRGMSLDQAIADTWQ